MWRSIAFLLFLGAGCTSDAPIVSSNNFDLNCAGWIDGFSKIGSETIQLGNRTYKTALSWNSAAQELTIVDADGPLAFCANIPNERCDVRVDQGHLIAHNETSGPGKRPDIVVRTIQHFDIDLQTLKGVKDSEVLSGTIIDEKTAKMDTQIKQAAQLTCERT